MENNTPDTTISFQHLVLDALRGVLHKAKAVTSQARKWEVPDWPESVPRNLGTVKDPVVPASRNITQKEIRVVLKSKLGNLLKMSEGQLLKFKTGLQAKRDEIFEIDPHMRTYFMYRFDVLERDLTDREQVAMKDIALSISEQPLRKKAWTELQDLIGDLNWVGILEDLCGDLEGRIRVCKRPECHTPYFIARDLRQLYCGTDCQNWAVAETKRKWWREHGEAWRKQRK